MKQLKSAEQLNGSISHRLHRVFAAAGGTDIFTIPGLDDDNIEAPKLTFENKSGAISERSMPREQGLSLSMEQRASTNRRRSSNLKTIELNDATLETGSNDLEPNTNLQDLANYQAGENVGNTTTM